MWKKEIKTFKLQCGRQQVDDNPSAAKKEKQVRGSTRKNTFLQKSKFTEFFAK